MQQQKSTSDGTAVVAHDTRHQSQHFARITATTMAAMGLKVYVFAPHARTVGLLGPDTAQAYTHRSTPLLSFAVRKLACDIGVMISASHNPPSDNGFKAYWDNGAQVVAPHDRGIIECVSATREIPTADFDAAVGCGQIVVLNEELDEAFADAILGLSLSTARAITAIFSPLHGVGETAAFDVIEKAGFNGVSIYEPHRAPDGAFPNVADHFPNPERTQVFEPIERAARESSCDLILATDPDADRVAVSVRDRHGRFVHLTGNQTGALLCDYICRHRSERGDLTPQNYIVETLVTTPLTARVAESFGIRAVADLLVGFKYIASTMDEIGPDDFVFGTEESLGYLSGQYARDKDASIACLYLLELAAELKAAGRTLADRLDDLYLAHGVHAEGQSSIVCKGPAGLEQIGKLMHEFRANPPESLAGIRLSQTRDYEAMEVRGRDGSVLRKIDRPQGNLVFLDSEPGDRTLSIAARPSGTEPKIKFYFFIRLGAGTESDLADARVTADRLLADARQDLDHWSDAVLED